MLLVRHQLILLVIPWYPQQMFRILGIAVCLAVLSAVTVQAQVVVQQPVVGAFSANTVVSVPDGGTAFVGGVSRAQDGQNTPGFSLGPNRGIGTSRQNSSVHVSVKIRDLHEEDEQVLSQFRARQAVDSCPSLAEQRFRALGGKSPAQPPLASPFERALSAHRFR